jgi:hypothetical protein
MENLMPRCLTVACLSLILFVGIAHASCQYCGSRLICEGDSIAKLIERCGQPLYTQTVGVETLKKDGREITRVVEKWFYENPYGAINKIRTYTIVSGVIVNIE